MFTQTSIMAAIRCLRKHGGAGIVAPTTVIVKVSHA
jgi:hypothetical protein